MESWMRDARMSLLLGDFSVNCHLAHGSQERGYCFLKPCGLCCFVRQTQVFTSLAVQATEIHEREKVALTTCISLPWSPALFCYVDRRRVVICAKNCWAPLRTGHPWAPRGDMAVEGTMDQEAACTGGGWGRRQQTTGTVRAGCRERGGWRTPGA